ncbi:MAG: hypothetical protein AAF639_23560 [Chloroflexota bacterium]
MSTEQITSQTKSTEIQADSFFQVLIENFSDAFGILNPDELETQKRQIIPESVQIDAVIAYPDNFDYTTLQDKIFPFLGKANVLEYKGEQDVLSPMKFYQYSLTELGILTTHLLSKERKDRTERQPLSVTASEEQWTQLKSKGARHGCCAVILSTTDPKSLRETVGFKAVDTYEHLGGALYRVMIDENPLAGSIATYLVIINHLPVHPRNAPLLLMSKGRKMTEFFQWLLIDDEQMTLQEKKTYLFYLSKYRLISIKEELREMKYQTLNTEQVGWLFDFFSEKPEEERDNFFKMALKVVTKARIPFDIFKKISNAETPHDIAQTALDAKTPRDAAQKMLDADTPQDAAQKLLEAETIDEMVLRVIKDKEHLNRINQLYEEQEREQQA